MIPPHIKLTLTSTVYNFGYLRSAWASARLGSRLFCMVCFATGHRAQSCPESRREPMGPAGQWILLDINPVVLAMSNLVKQYELVAIYMTWLQVFSWCIFLQWTMPC